MSDQNNNGSGSESAMGLNIEYFKRPVSIMRYLGILIMFITLIIGGEAYFGWFSTGRSYLAFGSLLLICEVLHLIFFGFNINKIAPFVSFTRAELVFHILEAGFLLSFLITEFVLVGKYRITGGNAVACVIFGFLYTVLKFVMFFFVFKEVQSTQQASSQA